MKKVYARRLRAVVSTLLIPAILAMMTGVSISSDSATEVPLPIEFIDTPDGIDDNFVPPFDLDNVFPPYTPIDSTDHLSKRKTPEKPVHTSVGEGVYHDLITIKFVEDSKVRIRNNEVVSLSGKDISGFKKLMKKNKKSKMKSLFTKAEEELDKDKKKGQEMSGEELADLNLYYSIKIDTTETDPETFIDELNSLDTVEIAYPEPIPQTPYAGVPYDVYPTTPNLVSSQGYLNAAPQGIDAWWAWNNLPYTRGENIKLIDIEEGWNLNHEDLMLYGSDLLGGTNSASAAYHGTSVLGELIGYENSFGVTGISNKVDIGLVGIWGHNPNPDDDWPNDYPNVPNALNIASNNLGTGDVMLVEVQARGGPYNEFIPVEYWQANYDVIRSATARGVVVVEAAGNGSQNLDDPLYNNRFNRAYRESGSLIVGAGTSTTHSAMSFSNYGSRIDVQGWGENVTTASASSYCNAFSYGQDQCYTHSFNGTSSASPIVAGAAAVIQSFYKNVKGTTYNSQTMRQLLVNTGTSETGTRHVGPLPNLRNALAQQLPVPDIKVNGSDGGGSFSRYSPINVSISLNPGNFANAQADWWIVVNIPALNIWYVLNSAGQWTTQIVPMYQGPLFYLGPTSVFNKTLSPGYTYVVYFGVDLYKNGAMDSPLYLDSVTFSVY